MQMKNLGFDDVMLIPRTISLIETRNDIDISVRFSESMALKIPFIAAPMKDVCDGRVASIMNDFGGMGIIHRFMPVEEQWKEKYRRSNVCCAIGINGDYEKERLKWLLSVGCKIFCIDTANAANIRVLKMVESLQDFDVDLIVGNVASKECYKYLDDMPKVRAIRVGIAGGAACTTKNATGIGYGMISSIEECASVKKNTLLIADGGIREPSDACKALSFGADLVMMGSVVANTSDSPAEILKRDGKWFKVYHGSASFEIQKKYKDTPKYIEGRTKMLEYDGESLETMINRFCDGLRSSMSYFNAKNLEEFRKNKSFAYS